MIPIPNFQCPMCGKMSVVFDICEQHGSFCSGYYRCLACGHELGGGRMPLSEMK